MKSKLILIVALSAMAVSACKKEAITPHVPAKLEVSKNPRDVDNTIILQYQGTNHVQLGVINLKAEGGTVTLDQLPVTLAIGSSGYNYYNGMLISNVYLYDLAGNQLDEEAAATSSTNGIATVVFQGLSFAVADQQVTSIVIMGDIVSPSYLYSRTFAQVSITGQNNEAIVAYDAKKGRLKNTTDTQQLNASYVGGVDYFSY